jgi:hypothetical protein
MPDLEADKNEDSQPSGGKCMILRSDERKTRQFRLAINSATQDPGAGFFFSLTVKNLIQSNISRQNKKG